MCRRNSATGNVRVWRSQAISEVAVAGQTVDTIEGSTAGTTGTQAPPQGGLHPTISVESVASVAPGSEDGMALAMPRLRLT